MQLCFAADKTLGSLAKWLRIMGIDTVFEADVTEKEYKVLLEGKRKQLTRTKRCWEKNKDKGCILIRSNALTDQLREVAQAVGLKYDAIRPFTRCIRCNTVIREIEKEAAAGRVPDHIWETHQSFRICDCCNRIYWSGSHIRQSSEILKKLFDIADDETRESHCA